MIRMWMVRAVEGAVLVDSFKNVLTSEINRRSQ